MSGSAFVPAGHQASSFFYGMETGIYYPFPQGKCFAALLKNFIRPLKVSLIAAMIC
jgi:hypothetical protein